MIFRKPVFWITATLLFIGGLFYSVQVFPKAFAILNVDLKMDREAAFSQSSTLAENNNWGPDNYNQVASFSHDTRTQNFVELDAGGVEKVSSLMQDGLYHFYTWTVRHYREHEPNETRISFTPAGDFYGFKETLSETEKGAALGAGEAKVIAENFVQNETSIQLSEFEAIETSEEVMPSERIDHTFVYQRTKEQIGDGFFRLKLMVSGDKVTELKHFIKVPETFSRRFEEMRSANNTLATSASIAMFLLYGFGGIILGLFFMMRKRWVVWKQAVYWGFFVAAFGTLGEINFWPLMWMSYPTALSEQSFFLQNIWFMVANTFAMTVIYSLSFMAAETLTRRAFPQQINLWQIWSRGATSSIQVLGRTIGGYLMIGFDLAFVISFYLLTKKLFGWWDPASTLFDPNVIATPFPWISSVSRALGAGFWEECLFRAVPIAGAALIGDRLGRRKQWIIIGFVVQSLIFAAAHANYPSQPAYARLVELIIPSIIFGLLYLQFGLLPAIISHFMYDAVLMSLPIFTSSASGMWFDQLMVFVLCLVPVWIILVGRWKDKKWTELGNDFYNSAFSPASEKKSKEKTPVVDLPGYGPTTNKIILLFGALGIIAVVGFNHTANAPGLEINRKEAIAIAENHLVKNGIQLGDEWNRLTSVSPSGPGQQNRFIWQTAGEDTYSDLMGNYIGTPGMNVRYAKFEGDLNERAEEYQVALDNKGKPLSIIHKLPENQAGNELIEDQAKDLVYATINKHYGLTPEDIEFISAEPSKKPERMDWEFVFKDIASEKLPEGDKRIRVTINGDEISSHNTFVFVPEEWDRKEKDQQAVLGVASNAMSFLLTITVLAAVVLGIIQWTRKKITTELVLYVMGSLFILRLVSFINQLPSIVAGFSTAQPYNNQLGILLAGAVVGALLISMIPAVLTAVAHFQINNSMQQASGPDLIEGIAIGIGLAGFFTFTNSMQPNLSPMWPALSQGGAAIPFLGVYISALGSFIISAAFMTFVVLFISEKTGSWSTRKSLFTIVFLLLGLMIAGEDGVTGIGSWIITGLLTGGLFLWLYSAAIRYNTAITVYAVSTLIVTELVVKLTQGPFPGASVGYMLAILTIVGVNFYWSKLVAK